MEGLWQPALETGDEAAGPSSPGPAFAPQWTLRELVHKVCFALHTPRHKLPLPRAFARIPAGAGMALVSIARLSSLSRLMKQHVVWWLGLELATGPHQLDWSVTHRPTPHVVGGVCSNLTSGSLG